jgi:hypothetical protein
MSTVMAHTPAVAAPSPTYPEALRQFRDAVELLGAAREVLVEMQARLVSEIERVGQAQAVCWEALTALHTAQAPANGNGNGHHGPQPEAVLARLTALVPRPSAPAPPAPPAPPVVEAREHRKEHPFVYHPDPHRPGRRARSAPMVSLKRDAPETYALGERTSAIIDALPGTPAEVAERTGLKLPSVRPTLCHLVNQGLVVKSGRALVDGHRRAHVYSRAF